MLLLHMTAKTNIAICAVLMLTFTLFSQSCIAVNNQTEIMIKPAETFQIPEQNSAITFAVNGTCSSASYKDGAWNFVNLSLGNMPATSRLNLTVSARDCNVTILSYQTIASLFAASPANNVRLRFNISGSGTQIFNLHLDPKKGDYSVIADGVFLGLFDGWQLAPDSTITLMGQKRNVSIAYYGDPYSGEAFLKQSYFEQHSVIITTSTALTGTVAVTAILFWRRKLRMAKAIAEEEAPQLGDSADGSMEGNNNGN
jgi:hypothetical protein